MIERANGIYSFSHLTFHEYFAALEITENPSLESLQRLATHITETRWREVFLLTVEMLPDANVFLSELKEIIDSLLTKEIDLEKFWSSMNNTFYSSDDELTQKAQIFTKSKPYLIRALYLGCLLKSFQDLELVESFDQSQEADKNWFSFMELISETEQDSFDSAELALSANSELSEISYEEFLKLGYTSNFQIELSRLMKRAKTSDMIQPSYSQNTQEPLTYVRNIFSGLQKKYQSIQQELESLKVECQRFRYEWQSVYEKRLILRQYHDANKLLINCLNSDCYVSREVRQQIEETLLLPIAEIEKRRKD